jgi:hypothetical protein
MKRFELISIGILAGFTACATPPVGTTTDYTDDATFNNDAPTDQDDSDDEPPADIQDDDDDDVIDDEPDDEPDDEEFQPVDGAWVTLSEAMPMDGCSMEDWVVNDPGQPIDVSVVSDSDFEILDARVNLQCVYDETGFDCLPSTFVDTTPSEDFGLNATLVLNLETYGEFDGPDLLTMHTEITASCSGTDCWLVALATASFPCEMSLITEAEAQ